jgi:hypothetical protein
MPAPVETKTMTNNALAFCLIAFTGILSGCAQPTSSLEGLRKIDPNLYQNVLDRGKKIFEESKGEVGKKYLFAGGTPICSKMFDMPSIAPDCTMSPSSGRFTIEDVILSTNYNVYFKIKPDPGVGDENALTHGLIKVDDALTHIVSEESYYAEKANKEKQLAEEQRCLAGQHQVRIGMRKYDVLRLACRPSHINTTTTYNHVREQWVYGNFGSYFYFDDGILTAVQN